MRHVFIVGSKGIPGKYGGFETFLDKLTQYHQDNKKIRYHIACKGKQGSEFEYHNAHCFEIKVPNLGSAQAIYYDIAAIRYCCEYIKKHHIEHPILYILACRIGPFVRSFHRKIRKAGGELYINPDGHEWLRGKWPLPVKMYWKYSERLMVKHCDLVICDNQNILDYIRKSYGQYKPETVYIAYGAELKKSAVAYDDPSLLEWYAKNNLSPGEYYLIVGRLVPENNFDTMLREFMLCKTHRDLVLITNENAALQNKLELQTCFRRDPRIKFVGSVYHQDLLMKIRENAYAYIHGHEVGGTNPSLLEALGSTEVNLLFDVNFNREVGGDGALYWTKENGDLAKCIQQVERMREQEIRELGSKAKKRITDAYSWPFIANEYAAVLLDKEKNS